MVDRNHVAVIFKLLRERIGQPRETSDAHPQIQVLSFNKAGRDVIPIRVSAHDAHASPDASSRAVVRVRSVTRCAVQLCKHRGVHGHSEGTFDGFRIAHPTPLFAFSMLLLQMLLLPEVQRVARQTTSDSIGRNMTEILIS